MLLVIFLSLVIKGLKTGMYYLRSRAAADAIKFTVDTEMLRVGAPETCVNSIKPCIWSKQNMVSLQDNSEVVADDDSQMAQVVCSLANRDECLACGS